MYRSLTESFPEITVISEENSQNCDTIAIEDVKNLAKSISDYDLSDDIVNINDITIWIDPLDATKEFTGNNIYVNFPVYLTQNYFASSIF